MTNIILNVFQYGSVAILSLLFSLTGNLGYAVAAVFVFVLAVLSTRNVLAIRKIDAEIKQIEQEIKNKAWNQVLKSRDEQN